MSFATSLVVGWLIYAVLLVVLAVRLLRRPQ
jgi:hypothetical protein